MASEDPLILDFTNGRVVDGADLNNGLLHVGLKRVVPEALKPRKIAIGGTAAPTAIANDAAEAAKAA